MTMVTRLRTTVIGGSNTVMQPGYLPQLLEMSARRGVHLDIVADLSVGGTTSAYGLYGLKTSKAIEQSDLLIMEYALNDAFIYGDERRQFRHWARLHEGILRHALARNPTLRICTLILGARNGSWVNSVPSIDAGIHYLADCYGTACIDVPRELLRRFGHEVVTNPAFYADQGHYSRPIATGMLADVAAEKLSALATGPWREAGAAHLPPPVDPEHFADAEVVTAETLFTLARDAGVVSFNNRRFSLNAIDLARHELTLKLDGGKLLGVFHVSSGDTAPLALHRNDTGYACSLLKGGVRDGKFKFLAAMLPCEFLYGGELLQPVGPETIRLGQAGNAEGLKAHVAKDNVAQATPMPDGSRLPLLGLMHSGKRLDLQVRPRANSKALAAA